MMKNLILVLVVVLAIIGLLSIQKNGLVFNQSEPEFENVINENTEEPTNEEPSVLSFDCPLPGNGLHLTNLAPGQTISFPYELEGAIGPGHWGVFEAVAGGVSYFDNQTNESLGGTSSPWMITGEWMTTEPKEFSLTLPEPNTLPENGELKIIFTEENPADADVHTTHHCEVIVNTN
jgi:hypothetical protein